MPVYSIHIQFSNGRSPYVRHAMTADEFAKEKEKWNQDYILVQIDGSMNAGFMYYKAFERSVYHGSDSIQYRRSATAIID